MMRNEHVVRAYQQPVQALNPYTGLPWHVVHVDSAAGGGAAAPAAMAPLAATSGVGTAEAPLLTLAEAQTVATNPFDVILVHQGLSANQPYAGGFNFAADHQFLVGQGSAMLLPTANMGLVPVWSGTRSSDYPVIAAGSGTAINLRNGAVVDHLEITGSRYGISDAGITVPGTTTIVNDVRIIGSGPLQTGVLILDAAGADSNLNFSNMHLEGLTANGFSIFGGNASAGDPRVNIDRSTFVNIGDSAISAEDVYNDGRVRVTNSVINGTTAAGVEVINAQVYIENTSFSNIGTAGVDATAGQVPDAGIYGTQSTVQVVNSRFVLTPVGVRAQATDSGTMNVTINENVIDTTGGNGVILSVADAPDAVVNASVVGNRVRGAATVVTGTVSQPNGNILLDSVGWSVDLSTDPPTVIPGQGILNIRAATEQNLRGLNFNASVENVPPRTVQTNGNVIVPPPPFYDPALYVPLPPH